MDRDCIVQKRLGLIIEKVTEGNEGEVFDDV
jgi:hypothetical protein